MGLHRIKKGLDLPIKGRPEQKIRPKSPPVKHVALLGHDYPTMKPRMHVTVGDTVKRGELLFEDRKSEGVRFTAPAAGKISAINRGEKRIFQSIVIELDKSERTGSLKDGAQVSFESYSKGMLTKLNAEKSRALLQESGLWTALRTRPFSRIPASADECQAIFVTAIDTSPLAASVKVAMEGKDEAFRDGLKVLSTLTEGKVFVCVGSDWDIDLGSADRVQKEVFTGLHPAGLVGTHINALFAVNRKRFAWSIGYQDVVAFGKLFKTGLLDVERVISIAGPIVKEPTLIKTRIGASATELTKDLLDDGVEEARVISGSVIHGHKATEEPFAFLNRYDNQLSCIAEDRERIFLGWLRPGLNKYSTIRSYMSRWLPIKKEYAFTSTSHGSHRAMVPIGMFERVMPLDVLPTFLLRSILVGDLERAEQLGCLELHEEDLALCSFVSPGKEDYGKALRNVLNEIWSEG